MSGAVWHVLYVFFLISSPLVICADLDCCRFGYPIPPKRSAIVTVVLDGVPMDPNRWITYCRKDSTEIIGADVDQPRRVRGARRVLALEHA
jgi:hypothetical protein